MSKPVPGVQIVECGMKSKSTKNNKDRKRERVPYPTP